MFKKSNFKKGDIIALVIIFIITTILISIEIIDKNKKENINKKLISKELKVNCFNIKIELDKNILFKSTNLIAINAKSNRGLFLLNYYNNFCKDKNIIEKLN
jgi:hypothetical protein